jgi:hypothetical protein
VDDEGNLILRTGAPIYLSPGQNVIRVALAEGEIDLPADVAGPAKTASDGQFACMDPAGIRRVDRALLAPVGPGGVEAFRDALGRQRETAGRWRGSVPLFGPTSR